MTSIPRSIEEIDAAWLANATGQRITAMRAEQIGVGIGVASAVYRLWLTGEGVPTTMVMKLKALDETAAFTSALLRMYEREVKFFNELAHRTPIRVPKRYAGVVSDDGADYVLVMEDMGGNRVVDQNAGMDVADAEQAIDELAAHHATFWGDGDRYVSSGAALRADDPIYPAVLPVAFSEGWEIIQAEIEVAPSIAAVAPRWVGGLEARVKHLSGPPTTLLHGDFRADNIFFDADGRVVLLDFQLTGVGSGPFDLAYFVTQSLASEVAGQHERALFDRYIEGLRAGGVRADDKDLLWDSYRTSALICLVYPFVAIRHMDLSDPRARGLADNMLRRCARAIEDLALENLLPE